MYSIRPTRITAKRFDKRSILGYREFRAQIRGEAPSSLFEIMQNEFGVEPVVSWGGIANDGIEISFPGITLTESNSFVTTSVNGFAEDANIAIARYSLDGLEIVKYAGAVPSEFFDITTIHIKLFD